MKPRFDDPHPDRIVFRNNGKDDSRIGLLIFVPEELSSIVSSDLRVTLGEAVATRKQAQSALNHSR